VEPIPRGRPIAACRADGGRRPRGVLAALLLAGLLAAHGPAAAGGPDRGAAAGPAAADSAALAPGDSVAAASADSLLAPSRAAPGDTLARPDTLAVPDTLHRALPPPIGRLVPLILPVERGPDRRRLRLELGVSTDVTNERYYEDETDTTFVVVGRRAITTPESRVAGVLALGLTGTRGRRSTRYELDQQLSLGDKVQRAAGWAYWRSAFAPGWTLVVAPRLDLSHDRTFDRDLTELRTGAGARIRRALGDQGAGVEAGLSGDLVRGTGSLALDHDGLWDDWRAAVSATARSYPDSSERDHHDLALDARWRHTFLAGHWLALEAGALRRGTWHPAATTRDDLDEARVTLEGEAHTGLSWSLVARGEGEGRRYDDPDSTLYFDQTVLRAWVAPRYEAGPLLSLAAGPRGEWLSSPLDPAEAYGELGGAIEFECFGRGAWWRIVPGAGHRAYVHEAQRGRFDPVGLHTDYDFLELDLLGDQGLPAGLRLRVLASGRFERHSDSGDDSQSLYFSLDVRRLLSPEPSGAAVAETAARPARTGP